MFMLFAEEAAGEAHAPPLVSFVTRYLGEPMHDLQMRTTKPLWDSLLSRVGVEGKGGLSPAETVFGVYTAENAIPWYTVMFIVACVLSLVVIWVLKGRLSEDEPGGGQQTLEVGILAVRNLLVDVIGPHGVKYFPVVATFGILILVSNLMGFIPGMLPPTASVNVTFALGITAFLYYNYIGIKENGLIGHFSHFAGPVLFIAPLIFVIEIISHLIRPMSLGIRLFGNIFADEQVVHNISHLFPPYTFWVVPVLLMPLGLFVAFIQTFIFVFLSMVYLSEVVHVPHEDHVHGPEYEEGHEPATAQA